MIENVVSRARETELSPIHRPGWTAFGRNEADPPSYVLIVGSSTDRDATLGKTTLSGHDSFVSSATPALLKAGTRRYSVDKWVMHKTDTFARSFQNLLDSTIREFPEENPAMPGYYYELFSDAASSIVEESDWEHQLLYGIEQTVPHDEDLYASDRVLHGMLSANTFVQYDDWILEGSVETWPRMRLIDEAYRSIYRRSITDMIDPTEMVDLLTAGYEQNRSWIESVSELLNQRLPALSLSRILRTWNFGEREVEGILDLEEGTIDEWQHEAIPNSMVQSVSELAAATDLLIHHIKLDRIAAVVRRPIRRLRGQSLVTLLSEEGTGSVLQACRDMFDFDSANG